MPRPTVNRPRTGNSKSQSKNPSDWANFEFANIRLSVHQQEEFHTWYAGAGDAVMLAVGTFLESEHKITLSPDPSNSCFICSVTCKDPQDVNYGFVLSSRSDDWFEALALCVYKHTEICGDTPWSESKETTNWG